jgi:chemotaxis protein histidine kinase CheA
VRWFGPAVADHKLSEYLFPDDPTHSGLFQMAFEQLAGENLPWELSLDQMPRRITRDEAILELDYKRVIEDEQVVKFLIVARDVTQSVRSEAFEQSTREQHELVTRLLQDKQGFTQFVRDAEALLSALDSERDLRAIKQHLHTLKGNVSLFGLTSLAERCHSLEEQIAVATEPPSAESIADLALLWRLRLSSIETFLTAMSETRLEIEKSEHDRLILSLIDRTDSVEIVNMVEVWSWPRTAERLARLRASAEHLSQRLEKSVEVSITHNELRAPRDYLEKFWSTLIHVVRNAVDHGAETEAERVASGKPRAMQLELITERNHSGFVISVRDDGRGIDRGALLQAARKLNPKVAEDAWLEELVFMDGVSSRDVVNETSGRGVGLSAVRQACLAEGGHCEVSTAPGRGTTFRFVFRAPVVKPGALAARLERRWSLTPSSEPPANQQTGADIPARAR